jgi:hypothetical protein
MSAAFFFVVLSVTSAIAHPPLFSLRDRMPEIAGVRSVGRDSPCAEAGLIG